MSRLALITLVFVLCALIGTVHASWTSEIVARGIVYPDSHTTLEAGGAGTPSSACPYTNAGTYPYSMLVGAAATYAPWNQNGGGFGQAMSFLVSIPTSYSIDSGVMSVAVYSGAPSDCYGTLVNVTQFPYSWDPYANGTAWSAGLVSYGTFSGSGAPINTFTFDFTGTPTAFSFYNNTAYVSISTFGLPNPNSAPTMLNCGGSYVCTGTPAGQPYMHGIVMESHNGASPPNMSFILKNFTLAYFDNDALPTLQSVFFNLQSMYATNQASLSSQSHAQWINDNMNLTALNGIRMYYSIQPKVLVNITTDPKDFCPNPSVYSYTDTSFIVDSGQLPDNDYIACFDLRAWSDNRTFIGVLDITNASASGLFTSGSLHARELLLSPQGRFFYNITYSPIVPSTLANFTISMDFGYPMYGRLNYRRTIANASQPPETITDSYGLHHSFTIPQSELNYTNVTITLYIEGLDNLATPHVRMQQPQLSLFATNITPIFPGVVTPITPYDDIVNHIGSGLNVLIDTAPCPYCVPPAVHLSIPAICSVDGGADRGTTLYHITPLNSSAPDHVHVVHWTLAEINGTGTHNVSCRPTISNANQFSPNSTLLNVTTEPTFLLVVLPNIPGCDEVVLQSSQSLCENVTFGYVQNLTYYGAWYCAQEGPPGYPSSYCNKWDGYACSNANVIPSGYPVNGSLVNVNCLAPLPGNFTQPPANVTVPPVLANNTAITSFIYNIFGMSVYVFLNFISLMVSLVLTIIVAVYSRSGLASSVVFLGGVIAFAVVGWLPLWVLIVLGVITSFLIAKFGRDIVFGGGGR